MKCVEKVLYTHDLRNSMNERTYFSIKIYLSHFILEWFDASVVCERWVERHILRERTSSSHIFFQEPAGANAWAPLQARQRRFGRLRVQRSNAILCTLSKSDCVVLITWPPSGYTPVRSEGPDAPSSSCLLVKISQLTKAHGVTRNEPKIHVICYITKVSILKLYLPREKWTMNEILIFFKIPVCPKSISTEAVCLFGFIAYQPL